MYIHPNVSKTQTEKIKRLAVLAASLLFIWFFIFRIAPWFDQRPSIEPIVDFIEERGIDASALYYTEIEEFAEAEIQINHSMRFTPTGP